MTFALLAAVIALHFTAPDGQSPVLRYEVRRCNVVDGCTSATPYADSLARDTAVVVAAPGEPQRVYVVLTTTASAPYGWRRGGAAIQIRARTAGSGIGEWSNPVRLAAGMNPDSLATDGRTFALPAADGVARFRGAVGDTSLEARGLPGPILGYEDAVKRSGWREVICGMFRDPSHPFGYVCLVGLRQGCP